MPTSSAMKEVGTEAHGGTGGFPTPGDLDPRDPASWPPGGALEADLRFAREALDVGDARDRDETRGVLGLELDDAVPPRGEMPLQTVGVFRQDERAHDLAAVEADLDPNLLARLSHGSTPPPRGRRAGNPDGRTPRHGHPHPRPG